MNSYYEVKYFDEASGKYATYQKVYSRELAMKIAYNLVGILPQICIAITTYEVVCIPE